MTRPNLIVGALAAVCVGTLLWCAWLILTAELPLGAHIASWALWVVASAAAATLLAYLREFLSHRRAVGRDASWKPLPSLVLLWIGGLTAMVSFAFILPEPASSGGAEGPAKAGTSLTSQTIVTTPTSAGTTTSAGTPRAPATTTSGPASRSQSRATAPSSTSTSASQTSSTTARTSSTTSSTTTPPTATKTTPIIDLDILPTQARPTTPPGH